MPHRPLDHLAIFNRQGRSRIRPLIRNPQTAPQVQPPDIVTIGTQRLGQLGHQCVSFLKRGQIGQLRADMHINSHNLDPRQAGGMGIDLTRPADRDAELVVILAGRDLLVRLRIHVRVHPHGDRGHFAQPAGHRRQTLHLGLAFDVELPNTARQRQFHLFRRLADTGKHDPLARKTGGNRPAILAPRYHIDTGPKARHQPQNRLVRIGLHGIAHQMVQPLQGLVKQPVMPLQSRGRIDIKRRANLGCNLGQGHILGMQNAVLIQKMIHRRLSGFQAAS